MTDLDYEFSEYDFSVIAEISLHKDFIECLEFVKTPFSNSTTILPNDFDFDLYDKIVVRCFFNKTEELKILQSSKHPQSFCVKTIEKYVEEKWSNRHKILYKTLTCNPYESQYMYLIEK